MKKCPECARKDKKIKIARILYITLTSFIFLLFYLETSGNLDENKNFIAYYSPLTQEITIKAGLEPNLNSTIFDVVHEHAHKIWYTKLTSEDRMEWKTILQEIISTTGTEQISDYCYECVNQTPVLENPVFIREEFAECYAQFWKNEYPCGLGTEIFLNRWMER